MALVPKYSQARLILSNYLGMIGDPEGGPPIKWPLLTGLPQRPDATIAKSNANTLSTSFARKGLFDAPTAAEDLLKMIATFPPGMTFIVSSKRDGCVPDKVSRGCFLAAYGWDDGFVRDTLRMVDRKLALTELKPSRPFCQNCQPRSHWVWCPWIAALLSALLGGTSGLRLRSMAKRDCDDPADSANCCWAYKVDLMW